MQAKAINRLEDNGCVRGALVIHCGCGGGHNTPKASFGFC
jgi:hypothetical protein